MSWPENPMTSNISFPANFNQLWFWSIYMRFMLHKLYVIILNRAVSSYIRESKYKDSSLAFQRWVRLNFCLGNQTHMRIIVTGIHTLFPTFQYGVAGGRGNTKSTPNLGCLPPFSRTLDFSLTGLITLYRDIKPLRKVVFEVYYRIIFQENCSFEVWFETHAPH